MYGTCKELSANEWNIPKCSPDFTPFINQVKLIENKNSNMCDLW